MLIFNPGRAFWLDLSCLPRVCLWRRPGSGDSGTIFANPPEFHKNTP